MRFVIVALASVALFFPAFWLVQAIVGPIWGGCIAAVGMYIVFPAAALWAWPTKVRVRSSPVADALASGNYFPFDELRLPAGESVLWKANNPTFHRSFDYGMVLTERALYMYSPFWISLARWRRIPLGQIRTIAFRDSRSVPSLRVRTLERTQVLRTPYDYADEMDYDRKNLRAAVSQVSAALANAQPSSS
jgi:hypothetical protein